MKVSVVIPVYNEEDFINACLESLLKQTEKPFEIIVVNNNSTDKTLSILKKFPVKIIDEKEQGMIPARNAGFNNTTGDIIARTDADTRVPPDWIERIRTSFENDPKLFALSGPAHFYDSPLILRKYSSALFATGSSKAVKIFLKHDGLLGFNYALTKKAWNKIKSEICLNDKEVHEDVDIASHVAKYGKVFFDKTLEVETSFRRLRDPLSLIEYPLRYLKMIRSHKKITN